MRIAKFVLIWLALAWVTNLPASELGAGINVNPWFTKPARDRNGGYLYPPFSKTTEDSFKSDLRNLKSAGFNFIRLPITSEPLLHLSTDQRREVIRNIRPVVLSSLDLGLSVIVDSHIVSTGGTTLSDILRSDALQAAYLQLLVDYADILVSPHGGRVYLELMNEPDTKVCNDSSWHGLQERFVLALREKYFNLPVIISGGCLSSVEGTVNLDMKPYAGKANIFVTFHYYVPFWFTHQGSTWAGNAGSKIISGLPWPARYGNYEESLENTLKLAPLSPVYQLYGQTSVEQAKEILRRYYEWSPDERTIANDFEKVRRWADGAKIPRSNVILGEFGVLKVERKWKGAATDSAARWIEAVRKESELSGFPWAMWSYKEGMALTVSEEGSLFYPELVKALGLKGR